MHDAERVMAITIQKMRRKAISATAGRAIVQSCKDLVAVMQQVRLDERTAQLEEQLGKLRAELEQIRAAKNGGEPK